MKENNISSYVQLMQHYVTKVLDIVERTNKSYVIWQDPIEEGTKVSTPAFLFLNVWLSHKLENEICSKTYSYTYCTQTIMAFRK